MKISNLIKRAASQGVFLFVEAQQLKFKLSVDAFPEDLKAEILGCKQELIDFLAADARPVAATRRSRVTKRTEAGTQVPVSFAQQRLWLLDQLQGGSAEYNMPAALRISGEFNVEAAEQAIRRIVARHQSLRTVFSSEGEHTLQIIRDDLDFTLERHDLTGYDEKQQQLEARALMLNSSQAPFDLSRDLMVRAAYLHLSTPARPDQDILLFNMHHIASDGWSMGVLLREFTAQYQAITEGKPDPLPPLAIQYADYAAWQRQWFAGQEQQRQLDYWLGQLADLPASHGLRLDHPRAETSLHLGGLVTGLLDEGLTRQLQTMAQRHQLTLFMLIHAALALVLSRHSNSRDIVLGTPVANRMQVELEPLIGFFVNTLVLRADTGYEDLGEFLAHIRTVNLDAQSHQDVPFEHLLEHCPVSRGTGHAPLFQIMLRMNTFEQEELVLPGVSFTPLTGEVPSAKYDLDIVAKVVDGQIELNWIYDSGLFDHQHIETLNEDLQRLLAAFVQAPGAKLKDLAMMSEQAQDHLIRRLNDTALELPADCLIHELFERQAAKTPNNIALVFEENALTYRQLDHQANRFAHYLRSACAITPDTLVGICVERSLDMVVAMLGILKAGAAYVPMDLSYPLERLNYMLDDAGIRVLVTQQAALEILPVKDELLCICVDGERPWSQYPKENIDKRVTGSRAGHLAYAIYTSGSTGKPKGVLVEHRNVVNFFAGLDAGIGSTGEQETWLAVTSISFDISVLELFWTLSKGAKVVLQPERPVSTGATKAMDLSLFYFAAEEASASNKYELLLEGAKFADRHQLSGVWVPERHFASFGDQFPNPSVAAAAVAAITRHVSIRSGSVVIPLHDPIRVAEEWSMVDNLSNGRVELSIASGWHPNDFVFAPDNYPNRQKTMWENTALIQQLWQGQGLKRRNGIDKEIEVFLHPRPVQDRLPIWVTAAGSEDTFRSAGAAGANLLTHMLGQNRQELQQKIAVYRQALVDAGYDKDHGKVALMLHTFVGEDADEVKTIVQGPFKNYLRHSVNLLKPLAEEAKLDIEEHIDAVIDMAFERYYHTSSLFGSPASCMKRVEAFQAIGVDEIACLVDFGVDNSVTLANLQYLHQLQQALRRSASHQRLLAKRLEKTRSPQELIAQHGVSHLQSTPSFLRGLLCEPSGAGALSGLEKLLVGGEALTPELAGNLLSQAPKQIFNMYGPTETTIWSAIGKVTDTQVTIGKPIANTQFYVADEQGQLLPFGVTGELYIGGAGVSRGYYRRGELTSARFIDDVFGPVQGQHLYKTGDLVRYRQDGELEYVGRIDDQVKIRGFRIELGEIEYQLCRCSGVDSALVTAAEAGEAGKQLLAYIKLARRDHGGGEHQEIAAIKQALHEALPYYMVPGLMVIIDEWPLTPNGKIDKKALPAPKQQKAGGEYLAPQTGSELELAGIWAELLHLDAGDISAGDNFIALGGDSLMAVRLIARVNSLGSARLTAQQVFASPVLADMAKILEQEEKQQPDALPAIIPEADPGITGLSIAQERFWFLSQLQQNTVDYNMAIALKLTGKLDSAAVEQAIAWIIGRHETLRTAFVRTGQGLGQQILTGIDYTLPRETPHGREVEDIYHEFLAQPFDLSRAPLLRTKLLQLAEQEHILMFSMHHIISDGWSLNLLIKEFSYAYKQFSRQQEPEYASLPVQYRDFARWQRNLADSELVSAQVDYWQQKLKAAPPVLNLTMAKPRKPQPDPAAGFVRVEISAGVRDKLKTLANDQQGTTFMVLLTAFKLLLAKHAASKDIIVGTPVANRPAPELEPLIGYFLNSLTLRTELDLSGSFTHLLGQVKQTCIEAFDHQLVSFEQLLTELDVERSIAYTPLFQIMFIMQNTPDYSLDLPGVGSEMLAYERQSTGFDMTCNFSESPAGISGVFEYRKDLFDEKDMQYFARQFSTIIECIAGDHDIDVQEIDEHLHRQTLSAPWYRDNVVAYDPGLSLGQRLEQQVRLTPQSIAIDDGLHQYTYRRFSALIHRLACGLSAGGVVSGDVVGICLPRSANALVSIFAVLKLGGIFMPLDINAPLARQLTIIADAKPKRVIVPTGHALAGQGEKVSALEIDELMAAYPGGELSGIEAGGEHPAYLYYTSGSSGVPKGVLGSHRAVINNALGIWQQFPVREGEVCAHKTNIAFIASVQEIFSCLLKGACLTIMRDETLLSPAAFLEHLSHKRVTRIFIAPSYLSQLLDLQPALSAVLPSLKLVLTGGEDVALTLVEKFKLCLPGVTLINAYGSTEVVGDACAAVLAGPDSEGDRHLVTIGRNVANMQARVLDENQRLCPVGVKGELYISGDSLALGYYNDPALSADKFIRRAVDGTDERLYKSGDLGRYLANGEIAYLGRADNQVKIRGSRVELLEVESALACYPGVERCICTLKEGAGGAAEIAAYIYAPAAERIAPKVHAFARNNMPRYMVPASLEQIAEVPVTANGKVDRGRLKAVVVTDNIEDMMLANSETEEKIAGIWLEVLDKEALELSSLSTQMNFFEAGGNSLMLAAIQLKIEESMGVKISVMDLFEQATIAALAEFIETRRPVLSPEEAERKRQSRGVRQARANRENQRLAGIRRGRVTEKS
ncbi:non-ribosomal peptide synthetase [Thalassomonas viridans]|uniref:Non-ribosomal peptide synthetase n=1 Tax=Thalassomonas viridans TaxID=137584 RepID=A0AAE9ZC02_9GAMM|nr:non-ribosomal peptide synthetase [Thalassomonas viridans]WDE09260.1 non-ribosomal peptide synthetase [Thalassomonas viridans]